MRYVILFFCLNAFAIPPKEVPAKVSCDKESVKDFSFECAEMRARDACGSHDEDFDQCVQSRSRKFLRRCSKSLAVEWCKICGEKPAGCSSLGKKKRPHRARGRGVHAKISS